MPYLGLRPMPKRKGQKPTSSRPVMGVRAVLLGRMTSTKNCCAWSQRCVHMAVSMLAAIWVKLEATWLLFAWIAMLAMARAFATMYALC